MPGRGCIMRKALRKAERQRVAKEEGLPPSKAPRITESPPDAEALLESRESSVGSRQNISSGPEPVPAFDTLTGEDYDKACLLCWAIYEAISSYGEGATVQHVTSHYKVTELKKDPCLANQRIVDIIKRHADLFEVDETVSSYVNWKVRVLPDAEEKLPPIEDEESFTAARSLLPERILDPGSLEETMQALRIEAIHALFSRGMKAMLNDVGQVPAIIEHRKRLSTLGKSGNLLELMRVFPENFGVEDQGHGNFMLELLDPDVTDMDRITEYVGLPESKREKGKGKSQSPSQMKFPTAQATMCAGKGKRLAKGGCDPFHLMMMEGFNAGKLAAKGMGFGKAMGKTKGDPMAWCADLWGMGNGFAGNWGMGDGFAWGMGFKGDTPSCGKGYPPWNWMDCKGSKGNSGKGAKGKFF